MDRRKIPRRKHEYRHGELFLWCNGCEKLLPEDDFHPDKTAGIFERKGKCRVCHGNYERYAVKNPPLLHHEELQGLPIDLFNQCWKLTNNPIPKQEKRDVSGNGKFTPKPKAWKGLVQNMPQGTEGR